MYPTLYHVSGEAGMDGCVEMMLDDVSFVVILSYLALSSSEYALIKKNIETCDMMINID